MKSHKLVFAVLIFSLSLFVISCSDDDDKKAGSFTYENKTYDLDKGELWYGGDLMGLLHSHNILLHSSGLSFDQETQEVSGNGNVVMFSVFSSSADKLNDMVYTSAGSFLSSGHIFFGGFLVNYNANTENSEIEQTFSDVNIDVSIEGETYILEFDGKDEENKDVSGKFRGPLKYIAEPNLKKSLYLKK